MPSVDQSSGDQIEIESQQNQLKLIELIQSLSATDDLPSDFVQLLLSDDVDIRKPVNNGTTFLHLAVQSGNQKAVESLLRAGHPWNVVDGQSKSVGDLAQELGYTALYEFLVEEGARTELLLTALGFSGRKYEDQENDDEGAPNQEYLNSKLSYEEGRLLDEEANGVMMGW